MRYLKSRSETHDGRWRFCAAVVVGGKARCEAVGARSTLYWCKAKLYPNQSDTSFQWDKRYSMTYHVAGNVQMITTDGSATSKLTSGCDWHASGVGDSRRHCSSNIHHIGWARSDTTVEIPIMSWLAALPLLRISCEY